MRTFPAATDSSSSTRAAVRTRADARDGQAGARDGPAAASGHDLSNPCQKLSSHLENKERLYDIHPT